MLLNILIPTTPDRELFLNEILKELMMQIKSFSAEEKAEVLIEMDNRALSVGRKRQLLLLAATAEYVSFVDDDDMVSVDYISSILGAIESEGSDVINFEGYMTTDGVKKENFKISKDLPYTTIADPFGNNVYLRHSNHLSVIKREIALKIGFNDLKFAEDYDFSLRLKDSGLIKTETYIPKSLYHYRYIKK